MSMTVRRLSRAFTAGLVAAAALTAAAHSAEAADTPGSAAAAQGRYFGTAVAARHLGEADYAATLDREFGSVTPENETKWDAIPHDGAVELERRPGGRCVDRLRVHRGEERQ